MRLLKSARHHIAEDHLTSAASHLPGKAANKDRLVFQAKRALALPILGPPALPVTTSRAKAANRQV